MPCSEEPGGQTQERVRPVSKEPTRYRVLLHNDDYTTMEFVVKVLEAVFHRSPAEAYRIMMQVHTKGRGMCGAYSYAEAETKVATTQELAKQEGFPLQATLEEE